MTNCPSFWDFFGGERQVGIIFFGVGSLDKRNKNIWSDHNFTKKIQAGDLKKKSLQTTCFKRDKGPNFCGEADSWMAQNLELPTAQGRKEKKILDDSPDNSAGFPTQVFLCGTN